MAHEEERAAITIGEALEVVANLVGDKPVDESDAAAIQAAEMRAIGATSPPVTGLGLQAQSAAMVNARRIYDKDKTTLAEVIGNATEKLESDKPVTRRDAEKVRAAELQGDVEGLVGFGDAPKEAVTPGGVAEAIATAATINQPLWDNSTSVVTPNEEVFYLVALLRTALENGEETQTLEYLTSQNRKILNFCKQAKIGVKQYLPHYTTQQEWIDHFGDKWDRFYKMKMQFDPKHILSTGQRIFGPVVDVNNVALR